jgi:hypothetical protein
MTRVFSSATARTSFFAVKEAMKSSSSSLSAQSMVLPFETGVPPCESPLAIPFNTRPFFWAGVVGLGDSAIGIVEVGEDLSVSAFAAQKDAPFIVLG